MAEEGSMSRKMKETRKKVRKRMRCHRKEKKGNWKRLIHLGNGGRALPGKEGGKSKRTEDYEVAKRESSSKWQPADSHMNAFPKDGTGCSGTPRTKEKLRWQKKK